MAKYFGKIGFVSTVESTSGVWTEQIIERDYYGDVVRNTRRIYSPNQINDNVEINNEISVVADPYAYQNIYAIRYLWWMDTRWKVTNVTVEYPRLILTIGGLYNGPQTNTAEQT